MRLLQRNFHEIGAASRAGFFAGVRVNYISFLAAS
jgi:hypothetical protein